ncbi:hypothetical protein C4F51_01890 [Cellvibrio sp. KB43]|uniref:Uncharacterized protein n=1 Tax=Cellvibrio polysaccharolyticus TaxID=2082724 RepID=A0A928V4E9_9GAMM|nr:hypothetical protein [Cellvibrio polysaccharolyticus]
MNVSLGVDLSAAPIVVAEQKEDMKMSNSNSNIMKSVKGGIVALLGRLVADSTSSESHAENALQFLPRRRLGVQFPRVPPHLTRPGTATVFSLRLRLHYKTARAGGVIGLGLLLLIECWFYRLDLCQYRA